MDKVTIESNIIDLVEAFRALGGVKYATVSANVTDDGVHVTLCTESDDDAASLAVALGARQLTRTEREDHAWLWCSHKFSDDIEIRISGPHHKVKTAEVQP